MTAPSFSTGEAARTRLREALAVLRLEVRAHPEAHALQRALASVETLLELGPEPAMRACPVCQAPAFRAATRCVHCWTTLTPLEAGTEAG